MVDSVTLATWITAISTVIYTAGTFMLWLTNKSSVRALERQLDILQAQLANQSAFNKVLANGITLDAHREIWLSIISNPELTALLNESSPGKDKKIACEFLGSILINHCARIHVNFIHGVVDSEKFAAFARDARYLFSFPLVGWRWKEVQKYHSAEFIQFVTDNIQS